MDFEGRNPEAQDFHGIKQLLKQLFLKTHIDLSGITTLLIQQNGVGSVLKQSFDDDDAEEDDLVDASDVYGITSVLNLSANKVHSRSRLILILLSFCYVLGFTLCARTYHDSYRMGGEVLQSGNKDHF